MRVFNCLPSPGQERDWSASDVIAANVQIFPQPTPDTLSLVGELPPVEDQGLEGSCVGRAVEIPLLHAFRKAGKLLKGERLSYTYLWQGSKETDPYTSRPTTFIGGAGTYLKSALDLARKYGVVRTNLVAPGKNYPGSENVFYAVAAQLKIASYAALKPEEYRDWLFRYGPIVVRLDVDVSFLNARNRVEIYNPSRRYGGHAVALVGYDPDGFIVRNSWGTSWGDNGHTLVTDAYARAAFTEAYGVTV